MNPDWNSFISARGVAPDGQSFGDLAGELAAARDGAIITPLSDQGLIRASGPEAAEFLHNLLTNDIKGLAPDSSRLAGFCTAKGRLLALFLVWREGDDYLLMMPRDILPGVLKKLSMYVLRSKVKLTDATGDFALAGVSCRGTAPLPAALGGAAGGLPRLGVAAMANGRSVRLDDTRWLAIWPMPSAAANWENLAANCRPVGLAAWQWLEIDAGQPRVVAATQEAFVPQMLNLELAAIGAVSFTKGCYPGQEIVARTHYLGKVKRRTFRARSPSAVSPGAQVYSPETGDQHCGTVVSAAPSPAGGFECLVCAQIGAVEAGGVRVGATDGALLEFLSLPYLVD